MKPSLILTAGCLTALGVAHSQTPDKPEIILASARIIGPIPDGTPPPPSTPKPEYEVATTDVVDARAVAEGGRTVTIQRIRPIALPPPIKPAPALEPVEWSAEMSEAYERARIERSQSRFWLISATVYETADAPPRTLVQQWKPGGKSVTYWSSADFALISGIHTFEDENMRKHSLFMGWGRIELERTETNAAKTARTFPIPNIPDFPEGTATWQLVGDPPDPETHHFIQTLHALYNKEQQRLQAAYEGREAARLQAEAQARANPPQPKDITVRFWRTETPAAQAKGGTK